MFTKALEKCLGLTKDQETPLDGTQKNWTHHVYAKTVRDLVSRLEQKRSEVFDPHEGEIGSQWLNVFSREKLDLELADQQLGTLLGLRLGAGICVAHTCHCSKIVKRDVLHGLLLHQECMSLLTACYSHFCQKADVRIHCRQCSSCVDLGQKRFVTSHFGDNNVAKRSRELNGQICSHILEPQMQKRS